MCSLPKKSHKKDRKLHRIESTERTAKLQNAAQGRNDLQMICRTFNEDLLEKGAVYYASCLSSYLSETNIQAKEKSKDQTSSMYQEAFDQLITEIHKDLTENGKTFYISSLLERFKVLLPDYASSDFKTITRTKSLYNHNVAAQQLTKVVPNINTLENDYAILQMMIVIMTEFFFMQPLY